MVLVAVDQGLVLDCENWTKLYKRKIFQRTKSNSNEISRRNSMLLLCDIWLKFSFGRPPAMELLASNICNLLLIFSGGLYWIALCTIWFIFNLLKIIYWFVTSLFQCQYLLNTWIWFSFVVCFFQLKKATHSYSIFYAKTFFLIFI